jgi:hypothetical protein
MRENWILYLDDVRDPKDGKPWVVARTAEQAKNLILQNGMPDFISFDHDLGYTLPENDTNGIFMVGPEKSEETGYDFAKWLIEQDQNGKTTFSDNFGFFVHSANPIGAKNIQNIIESYLKFKRLNNG